MELPIRTTLDDIRELCKYFVNKPTGATIQEAKAVLDKNRLDARKITALKYWLLIEEQDDGKLKLTTQGRRFAKGENEEKEVLIGVLKRVPPYNAIIERAAYQREDSIDTIETAAHWHNHFKADVSDSDKGIQVQAVCFFHVATGAGLGNIIAGRRGNATRFSFLAEKVQSYISIPLKSDDHEDESPGATNGGQTEGTEERTEEAVVGGGIVVKKQDSAIPNKTLGQGIFVAHGKNKKPLEQLKKILDEFKIPYKVAIDEPNLGRPISSKVREIMQACNCAILIFTADEKFKDDNGNEVWRPSENVVYELGATGYLYDNRIVILKEDKVNFPSNFNDIGHISFSENQLSAKTLDLVKELIGFGIVKIST